MVNRSGSMSRAGGCCNESGSHVRAVQMLRNPWRREAHELPVLKRTSFLWAVSIMQRRTLIFQRRMQDEEMACLV
ncbi:hypothetical protein NC651_017644 [Populus alba x Populus x berolinensis]|nr:hypothetical protein NC651_017644 [Populus alba x Populus x berolinensis]